MKLYFSRTLDQLCEEKKIELSVETNGKELPIRLVEYHTTNVLVRMECAVTSDWWDCHPTTGSFDLYIFLSRLIKPPIFADLKTFFSHVAGKINLF